MMRSIALAATALLAAACAKDPAASVSIAIDGLVDGGVAHGGARMLRAWRPALCPPPPELAGRAASHLVFGGACAFEHAGAARCEVNQDDMYVTLSRRANDDAAITLYVNVEHYQGRPGAYDDAEVQLSVQDRGSLFRWTGRTHVTVEAEAKAVRFDRVTLGPELGTSTEGDEWLEGIAACAEPTRGD